MTLALFLLRRCRALPVSGAVLLALLQRTPVLRVASAAGEALAASPLGAVLRPALAGLASLGAVHSLAGATQWSFSRPPPITGAVGTTFTPLAFTIVGAPTAPGSFRVTGLPPGLAVLGVNGNGVLNASTGLISGTPTVGGTFQVLITAFEFNDEKGDRIGPEPLTMVISGGGSADSAPVFTAQPASQSATVGATVSFTAGATGVPVPTFQWRRGGSAIPGATAATLTLANVQLADAGDYTVAATNVVATTVSNVATLTVAPPVIDPNARLSNLSVRTSLAAGQTLIVGVVIGGGAGARDVLVRAAGPALSAFGLAGVMADPRLDLFQGATSVFSNDDWPANLAPTFASVGAFAFPAGSRDAAFLRPLGGAASVQARGTGAGIVLVEAYDTGPATAAKLINVSARNRVGTGADILIAGFTVTGSGAKRLLIRAVGPKLGSFGVTGFLADPVLEIYTAGGALLTANDNWSADLAATFGAVGAFGLDAGSRDAALVTVLAPGSYTAQVRGAGGGTGEALVEIYEAP